MTLRKPEKKSLQTLHVHDFFVMLDITFHSDVTDEI